MTITASDDTKVEINMSVKSNGHSNGLTPKWYEFDLHGVSAFRVEASSGIATLFKDMFRPFLAEGLEHFDLTISEAKKLADVFDIPFENFLEGKEFEGTVIN